MEEARAEQAAFAQEAKGVGEGATFGNNPSAAIPMVTEALLDGEILHAQGRHEAGFERMREAVRREGALRYNEPPDWIQPTHHALGAVLLRSGE